MERWPTRLKDEPGSRAGALLRGVGAPAALTAQQVARIDQRLGNALLRPTGLPLWLRRALAIGAFAGGGLAFAAIARWVVVPPVVVPATAPVHLEAPAPAPDPKPSVLTFEELDLSVPIKAPVARKRVAHPQTLPGMDLSHAAAPVVAMPAAGGPLCLPPPSERLAVGTAERQLMTDAAGAIRTLDQFRRDAPGSCMQSVAEGLRVKALMRLGRRADALTELERHAPTELPLLLLNAELLRDADRCLDAVPLYDRLAPVDSFAERVLSGRAFCRADAGDAAGAASDARTYLKLFPDGRFADHARALAR
jgi:hypothetical protein